jgi:dCTP deaminase
MFLSDIQIREAVKSGDITIQDFDEKRLQPASYDILLGNKFIMTEGHLTEFIDPARNIFPKTREIELKDDESFVLHPQISMLGTSWDYFGAKADYVIQLSGKSSLARIGLIVHNTAGLINPGHYLNITLELCNLGNVPIILRPKMEIAQLLFSPLSAPVSRGYSETGRYHDENWQGLVAAKEKSSTL